MNPTQATAVLERLARRAWGKQVLRLSALVLAVVLPLTIGLGVLGGWTSGRHVLVGLVLLAGGIALSLGWLRRKGIDARLVAAHLDRTQPALEESAALLLQPTDTLRLIERIQQRRALEAFSRLSEPPTVPGKGLRMAGVLFCTSLVFSVSMTAWMPRPFIGTTDATPGPIPLHVSGADSLGEQIPVAVKEARVRVTAPAYAGLRPALFQELNFKALQNARAVWEITLNQEVQRATIHFSDVLPHVRMLPKRSCRHRG